jgi:hypothetical protein
VRLDELATGEFGVQSPATSTNREGGDSSPPFLLVDMVEFEKSLQAASDFLFFAFSVQLDELATGEFGVHPSLARRSRHFDQQGRRGFIPAFSVPNNLHQ